MGNFYGCVNGKRGREVRATLGKNTYTYATKLCGYNIFDPSVRQCIIV
jgi:hypothetical protein